MRASPSARARVAWHAFAQDILVCARCSGEMRVVGVIFDPAAAEQILRHLGLWQRGSPRGRHVVVESRDHESRDAN